MNKTEYECIEFICSELEPHEKKKITVDIVVIMGPSQCLVTVTKTNPCVSFYF